ncbi:MAG: hypothetical protein HYX36_01625 [Rhizobiales bacterium]|nr:hypothetical protein [Hyphomicrobiales bacterium]
MSPRLEALTGLDLRLGQGSWDFAEAEKPRIEDHWRKRLAENPHLWNGEVLICRTAAVTGGMLAAEFSVSDYASFLAWRDWGFPDPSARNCFGVPAVLSADGALLFGVMGARTLNAGKVYPPSGTLERRDVRADGTVDIRHSMHVELAEETGLDAGEAEAGPLFAIFDGQRLAVVEAYRFAEDFGGLAARFARHQETDAEAELAAIEAIRGTSQIDSRMPLYAQEIIRYFTSAGVLG